MDPLVEIRPIGAAYETLFVACDWFGILLGKTEEVLARGYAVLKALRGEPSSGTVRCTSSMT